MPDPTPYRSFESPLSEEQKTTLLAVFRHFGALIDDGMLFISSAPPIERGQTQHPTPYEEDTIGKFRAQGLAEIYDHRQPDIAGESGEITTEGNPEGGITIIFSDSAQKYLEKLKEETN